jgi:hypothetical protein
MNKKTLEVFINRKKERKNFLIKKYNIERNKNYTESFLFASPGWYIEEIFKCRSAIRWAKNRFYKN